MHDVIIIGAGAAGLMAGSELVQKNKDVIILEARDRIGGRMNTIQRGFFSHPTEEGAEFIHGEAPLTFSLLNNAQAKFEPSGGRMWKFSNGLLSSEEYLVEDFGRLDNMLRFLKEDKSIEEFLLQNFDPVKDAELIKHVRKFVEGFDAADPVKASAITFRDEWFGLEEHKQFRIDDGYKVIYNYLVEKYKISNGGIVMNSVVKKINWKKNNVEIICSNKNIYRAKKIIVTIPTGVLRDQKSEGHITFHPFIPFMDEWINQSGYGSVIKILFQFKYAFWDDELLKKENYSQAKEMGFLFSDEIILTWWSQLPDNFPLLTGWLAGPKAERLEYDSNENIFLHGLHSLVKIFSIDKHVLLENLVAWHVKNWAADPFSRGAYSYNTPHTKNLLKKIIVPLDDTIYFAGEAIYDGKEIGTVEAALASGKRVADSIN